MYLFTTIPHNWWILLTVIMMSAAIEPGLIIKNQLIGEGNSNRYLTLSTFDLPIAT